VISWFRQTWAEFAPFGTDGVYLNFRSLADEQLVARHTWCVTGVTQPPAVVDRGRWLTFEFPCVTASQKGG
jgi:hypothetical protein